MSDALEMLANGKTAFADSRKDAWHQKGQQLDGAFTAEQAMEQAYLGGWDVRKTELKTTATVAVGGEDMAFELDVPRQFATVRTNPVTKMPEVLGVVGNSYLPIQNEEHADLLNAIVDEGGAHFETAGSLNGGTQVFITMKMPLEMQVAGKDRHDLYLSAFNSHDGSSSFRFLVTPIRVVCANTQAVAMKNFVSSFSVRHTKNAKNTITAARQALELTFKFGEGFEEAMEQLMNESFTTRQMGAFADKLWTPPAKDASRTIVTRHADRLALVKGLFAKSPTLTDYKGTKYAAYNAVTEYLDHFSPVPATQDAADVRATRTLTSDVVRKQKEQAFAMLAG